MNFSISEIEKIGKFIDGKLHDFIVHIDMDGMKYPLVCTKRELLNFKELQFKMFRQHDRVITMDMANGPYQWELYLDKAMQWAADYGCDEDWD